MKKILLISFVQLFWLNSFAQERQWFSEADITGLNFPGDARNNAVSFVIGDTAYVGTGDKGSTTLTDFWKYVPETNTWSQITDFPGIKRTGAVAFTLNGKGYVGLGKSGSGDNADRYKDFYRYDPTTKQWEVVTAFGGTARNNAVAFTIDGAAYVGTGEDAHRQYTDDLWKYDPNLNSWSLVGNLPLYPRSEAIAFSINGLGYIGCGLRSGFNFANNMYEFNPTDDTFRKVNNFPTPYSRTNGVAFVLDGKSYIGLGFEKKDFVIYDPTSDDIELTSMGMDEVEDQFGQSTESDRWGAVAFVIKGKAFVGLGGVNNGASTNNDLWSFQYPTPDAPEALTISSSTVTAATLQWTDRSNNEQGFEIERSVGDNTSFTLLTTVAANTTTYQDATLSSDQVYYYRVRAIGATENSLYTNEVTVNTYIAPDNLTATAQGANEIALSWQDNSSLETGFVIERSADGVTFTELATLPTNAVAYTDMSATAGSDYQYRVYALVGDVYTDATNIATAGTLTAPTTLSVASTTGSTVQISWNYSGSNASHYVIERKTGNTGNFVRLDSIAVDNGKTYTDATVEEVQQYTYRIKTTDATRSSGFSAEIQATTGLNAPTAVTATVQDSTVLLSWNDASQRETHYTIYRSLADGSALVAVNTVVANTISLEDTTIPENGDYRYSVRTIGATTSSTSVESNVVTVSAKAEMTEGEDEGGEEPTEEEGEEETTEKEGGEETTEEEGEPSEEEMITGTYDPLSEEVVKVYPNPSSGQISVHVGSERFAYVAIFNSQGRLVNEVQQAEQSATATVRLDLQHFPAGMYTLQIYTARGVFVRKIAKQ